MSSASAKNVEKRREEAMEYLVKKYYESKIHEEELRKKFESYSRIRRWIYKRGMNLKDAGMIFKEIIVRPFGLIIASGSGLFSWYLALRTAPNIHRFIDSIVPSPWNSVIGLITVPIGWSPLIIAEGLYVYYTQREIRKRLKEDYGIEIS